MFKKLLISTFILFGLLSSGLALAQTQSSVPVDLKALVEQLQAQIKALQTQVESLKAELNVSKKEIETSKQDIDVSKKEIESIKEDIHFSKILKRGETGDEVRKLQEYLSQFQDIYPEGLVTGYYGAKTEAAVRKLQEKHGLESVGVVGPKTVAKLNELLTEGAGQSGIIPPGLLTALGIQKKLTSPIPSVAIPTVTLTSTSVIASSTIPAVTSTLFMATTTIVSTTTIPTTAINPAVTTPAVSFSAVIPSTSIATQSVSTSSSSDTTSPTTPSNIIASSFDPNKVIMYWSPSTDDVGVVGYKIYRDGIFIISVTSSAYNDTNLVSSTLYTYTVAAYDAAGNISPQSSPKSVSTLSPSTITITSPNGGEQLTQGNTYPITWTSTGNFSSVTIELYYGQSRVGYLGDGPNSGSWSWAIPTTQSYNTDAKYSVRVINSNIQTTYDDSNNYFSIAIPQTPVVSDPASLIGRWKFDGNGNNEVAGRPNAIIVGNATFTISGGKLDGHAYVPGSSDWLKIPYNSVFDLPDSFTIEFWFRQRSNQSFTQDLIYKGTPPNNYNFLITRLLWNQYNYGPIIAGHTAANSGFWTQPSNPNQLAHNEWHHVVFTKSPNYHAYYLDGTQIGFKDLIQYPDTDYTGPAKTPHNDIIIGDSAVDTDFDELRIYNRALGSVEVLQHYQSPSLASGLNSAEEQLASIVTAISKLAEDIKKLLAR